jgi:hypothetical protein
MPSRPNKSDEPVPIPEGFSFLTTLPGHIAGLSSVIVTPDGRSVVSSSYGNTEFPNVTLKGFSLPETLWAVEAVAH